MKIIIMAALMIVSTAFGAQASDGTDQETGSTITVEKGNLVRSGRDIEIEDAETGDTHSATVESVDSNTLEVYDHETGDYRTFDME